MSDSVITETVEDAAEIVKEGFGLLHFSEEEIGLEEVFMRITKGVVA